MGKGQSFVDTCSSPLGELIVGPTYRANPAYRLLLMPNTRPAIFPLDLLPPSSPPHHLRDPPNPPPLPSPLHVLASSSHTYSTPLFRMRIDPMYQCVVNDRMLPDTFLRKFMGIGALPRHLKPSFAQMPLETLDANSHCASFVSPSCLHIEYL